jgi:predicted aminopeptidase
VLSTFVDWPDADLAGLIFHELAHGRLFVPGDTPFNEAFASFVERRGVLEWLRVHDPAREEATQARWNRSDRFVAYLLKWRDELQRLFVQPYNGFARRMLKTELLTAVERCYRANTERFGDQDWYFSGTLNNARFVPLAAYNELRDAFESLFAQSGESWPRFYSSVADIGGMKSDALTESLKRLGDAFRSDHASEGAGPSCDVLVF